MIERVVFYSYSNLATAIENYRVLGPLNHAGIELIHGINDGELDIDAITKAQIVIIQRDFAGAFTNYEKVLAKAHELQKPVVLDLDDNLLALPQNHPDRVSGYYANSLSGVLHAIIQADTVTVTTEYLRKSVEQLNSNVFVLPNYFDDSIWTFQQPRSLVPEEITKVLFMGSSTHLPDLEMLALPLGTLVKRLNGKVSLVFYGIDPPISLKGMEFVEHIQSKTFDYRLFAKELLTVNADIGIAPLINTPFNRSKSAIKYFEYSAMGIPTVCSDLEPYRSVVEDGVNGFLADDPESFIEKIQALIEDKDLRRTMVMKAQEKIRKDWMINNHAHLWSETYEKVKVIDKKAISVEPLLEALGAIGLQLEEEDIRNKTLKEELYSSLSATQEAVNRLTLEKEELSSSLSFTQEAVNRLNHEKEELSSSLSFTQEAVNRLNLENEELSSSLIASQNEIVDYVTSTSWKVTRPLRKLGRLIRRE